MAGPGPETLVVNVRRGDYYTVDAHRHDFGIDIRAFVDTALALAVRDGGTPADILVVSDDVAWCRANLHDLVARVAPVTYGAEGQPLADLAAVVHARRVILPNSTFSYWAGFIGDHLARDREVYVPWLFSRGMDGGRSEGQVSPAWTIVDLPGGWPVPDADS